MMGKDRWKIALSCLMQVEKNPKMFQPLFLCSSHGWKLPPRKLLNVIFGNRQ